MKRLLLALSLLLPASLLRAEAQNRDSLVHLTSRPWITLDPADSFDSVSFIVAANVYEPLIAFKSVKTPDDFIPFLAEKVPTMENGLLSKDELTYTFPIRKGVHFHSGDTLAPEDVRYSILRFMILDLEGGPAALLLRPILGVYRTRDEKGNVTLDFKEAEAAVQVQGDSVVIHLKKPSSSFLKILASWPIVTCKKWAVEHGEWDGTEATWKKFNNRPSAESYLRDHMNGTGPYRLAKLDQDGSVLFERNEEYWRKPAALKRVLLKVVHNKAIRFWMLENGDADSSYLEDQDFAEASRIPGVKIVDNLPSTSLGELLFFTFNASSSEFLGSGRLDGEGVPPDFFKDLDVRRGFAYAIDYDAYLRMGMGMRGKRCVWLVPGELMPLKAKPKYHYDQKKAEEAFRKAWGGKVWENGFTVALGFSHSNGSRRVLAELLKASLEKINPKFKLKIKALHSAEFYETVERHELPVFISGYYADYPDPGALAFGLLHSEGYFPRAQRYSNPKMDELVERGESIHDSAKRREAYLEIKRAAAEDLPSVCTYQPTRFKAMRAWVKGYEDEQNVANLNLNNFPYFYALSKQGK